MLYWTPCETTHCVFCGGTVLDNKHVLTAAHCIPDDKKKKFVVRVGGVRTRFNGTDEWWCTVKNTIIHTSYTEKTYDYDAALIEIDRCTPIHKSKTAANEIVMTDYVRPICLPTPTDIRKMYQVGFLGYAAGWGRRNVTNEKAYSRVLRDVDLPVSSTQACQNHFAPQSWPVTSQMFCARDNSKDTCQGDSGGPFMGQRHTDRKWVVTGIISWGDIRCGHGYGVYVKVGASGVINWIKKTLKL